MSAPAAQPVAPQASDLPPEVAALIDTAIAARAAESRGQRRPVVRFATDPRRDAPLTLPRLNVPKRQGRGLGLEDVVLAGLFVGLLLAAWVSLLVSLNLAEAAERTTDVCVTRSDTAGRAAPSAKLCARLPQQG